MSYSIEEIKSKLRKLQSLIEDKGATEHEAAAALRQSQKLLAKYNLTLADLADPNSQPETPDLVKYQHNTSGPWARRICSGIAMINFCEYFYYSGRGRIDTHVFVGKEQNRATTESLARLVLSLIQRQAVSGARSSGEGTPYRNSFRNAAANRIYLRCWEIMEASKNPQEMGDGEKTTLPALTSLYQRESESNRGWIDDHFKVKTQKSRARSTSARGVLDGQIAGSAVPLQTQITH